MNLCVSIKLYQIKYVEMEVSVIEKFLYESKKLVSL